MAKIKKLKGRTGWYIDYRDHTGKRIIRKAGRTRREANHTLGQIMARVEEQRHKKRHGEETKILARDVALPNVAKQYLRHVKATHADKPRTHECYRDSLADVLAFLAERGVVKVGQISTRALNEYREVRMTESRTIPYKHRGGQHERTLPPVGPRTVNRNVGALKTMLNWAAGDGDLIAANPIVSYKPLPVKKKRKVRRALTRKEKRVLLEASPEPFRSMWALMLGTGLRKNELVELTWADVDLDRGRLVVRSELSKNSEMAEIPLRRDLWALLADMYERRGTKHVFVNSMGRPWRNNLLLRFYRCLDEADIERKTPEGDVDMHSLRVTYGTDLVEAGVDPKTWQRLMRHKSARVALEFYAKVKERNLRPAVERIPLDLPGREQNKSGNKVETSRAVKNAKRPARNHVSS